MLRFSRRGIPFDTGFHFTSGFGDHGVLSDMLTTLGIAEAIRPDFLRHANDNRFVFEDTGKDYALPLVYEELCAALKHYFPGENNAIDRYFAMIDRVCENTMAMNLQANNNQPQILPECERTLADVLDGLTDNSRLKTMLAAYCTCYGVTPEQVSFANHSRICHGLYRSVARVHGGGQAFTNAFRGILKRARVDIRCSTALAECTDVRDRRVGRFVLSSGEEVAAEECIFTIHPRETLATLPRAHLHKAFIDRVEEMDPSVGFFCLYGVVPDGVAGTPFSPAIISLAPDPEMRHMFQRTSTGDRVAVIMKHRERIGDMRHNVITALEASEPADVAQWTDSVTGRRPSDYYEYKTQRRQRLEERLLARFPEYKGHLEILETASMLTFRDYLHTPWGCAYGVRQTFGQINLFGRLPLRNLYAAGQSAMLPGVVGSMLASFILAKTLLGRETYQQFITRRLPVATGEAKI